MVLHGGSGISNRSLSGAIEIGVAKVNYGTYLKQRCLDRISRAWHPYVGEVMRRRLAGSLNLPRPSNRSFSHQATLTNFLATGAKQTSR